MTWWLVAALLALAIRLPSHGAALPAFVLTAALAVAGFAIWSRRVDPPVWRAPGPNWSGRFK